MIKVSILYPVAEGKRFDFKYYLEEHNPFAIEKLKPFGLVKIEITRGISDILGGPPPFFAMGHIYIALTANTT